MINLAAIAIQLGLKPLPEQEVLGFSIDTRTLKPGYIYVALKGDRFDGHTFIADAASKGALAVICEHASVDVSIPQLVVSCALDALCQIAALHRKSMSCPVIALTGSNGKTTVKEMIASILPKPACATPGNFNNHIGVPLAMLRLRAEHRYAVFELGANHPGEIAHTVALVKPDVALVNNIAPAHIEGFGSIEGVASAKGEIYAGLGAHGCAIINDDGEYAHFWDPILGDKRVYRFSRYKKADVYATDIELNDQGCGTFQMVLPKISAQVQLRLPGMHQISNALAAATCCYAVGIDIDSIVTGLSLFEGVHGRMSMLLGKNNACVIDDTYNANLRSVLAAIDVLAARSGRRILVLGDMGELGVHAASHHETIGFEAKAKGIDLLMTCGIHSQHASKAFGSFSHHYVSQTALVEQLLREIDDRTTVLVKGSRSATMENIVHQIRIVPK